MNIPDKAVEAAAKSNFEQINGHLWDNQPGPSKDAWRRYARRTLDAAAPLIAAQALRDLASDFPEWAEISNTFHVEDCVGEFNRRADELEGA